MAVVSSPSFAQTYRTTTTYDASRRPVVVSDAVGNELRRVYDANGRVTVEARSAPGGQWLVACTSYTPTGAKARVWGPYLTAAATTCPSDTSLSVPRTDTAYDGLDRVLTETALLAGTGPEPDRQTRHIYDAAGQLVQLRRAVGTALEQAYATYAYTLNGKQQVVIDANGNRAELRYDGHDRQDRWTFPSVTRPGSWNPATVATALATSGAVNAADYEEYGYDAGGNRTSLRKRSEADQPAGSHTIAYSYDALNRMTLKVIPTGGAANVHYDYDLRGAQLYARFASTGGVGITNTYDKAGRLASSSSNMSGTARTTGYLYDIVSNRTRLTHPDGQYFTYAFDALNRVTEIRENGAGLLAGFVYDSLSRRTALNRGSGADATVTSTTYDATGRLNYLNHNLDGAGGTNDQTLQYVYNRVSQVVSRTSANDLYAATNHYDVDRNYTTNGLNQYTAAGPASFTYDPNGNLTWDGGVTFVYDVENRLVGASGGKTATLIYDPTGRLQETSGGPAGITRFVHDGDALIAEYDSAGVLLRRYVHGPGVDEPIVWYEGAAVSLAARRYLHADHQGSIVAVASAAGGAALQVNAYDAYGIANDANLGRFAYTGQIAIPELGIYHYKARAYSPTLGRFLQTDPIGYDDQINLYAYVGNDPVNKTDPSGMAEEEKKGPVGNTCSLAGGSSCSGSYAKGNAPIIGTAQNPGGANGARHARISQALAQRLSRLPGVKSVHLNRSLRSITNGRVNSLLRPDVAAVLKNGSVVPYEVPSTGQTSAFFSSKYGTLTTAERQIVGQPRTFPLSSTIPTSAFARGSTMLGVLGVVSTITGIVRMNEEAEGQIQEHLSCVTNADSSFEVSVCNGTGI